MVVSAKFFNPSIIDLDEVSSTNSYALDLIRKGEAHNGLIVRSKHQKNGKGQRDAKWDSAPRKNLLLSLILKVKIDAARCYAFNMVTALAVRKLLEDVKIKAVIKWPNDLLVNTNKICGILIENQIQGREVNSSVIGIGLNLNQEDFDPSFYATSTFKETGNLLDIEDVTQQLAGYIDHYLGLYLGPKPNLLSEEFHKYLFGLNSVMQFCDPNDKYSQFEGIIRGVDEDGLLLIESSGVLKRFSTGEIKFCMHSNGF